MMVIMVTRTIHPRFEVLMLQILTRFLLLHEFSNKKFKKFSNKKYPYILKSTTDLLVLVRKKEEVNITVERPRLVNDNGL